MSGTLLVFDGTRYNDWCVKMEAILGFQEVDEIVKVRIKEPSKNVYDEAKKVYREKKKLDCKARMLLHQCVTTNVCQKISKATTTKEAWDMLLAMIGHETVAEYFRRLHVLVNNMRACDESVEDSKMVEKMLRTLTPQYDHIKFAIEETRDLEKMTVEELHNCLKAHEQWILERKNIDTVT